MADDEDVSCADGTKDELHVKIDAKKVLALALDTPGNTDDAKDQLNERVILHEHEEGK